LGKTSRAPLPKSFSLVGLVLLTWFFRRAAIIFVIPLYVCQTLKYLWVWGELFCKIMGFRVGLKVGEQNHAQLAFPPRMR
jgi:hypothetical protein